MSILWVSKNRHYSNSVLLHLNTWFELSGQDGLWVNWQSCRFIHRSGCPKSAPTNITINISTATAEKSTCSSDFKTTILWKLLILSQFVHSIMCWQDSKWYASTEHQLKTHLNVGKQKLNQTWPSNHAHSKWQQRSENFLPQFCGCTNVHS